MSTSVLQSGGPWECVILFPNEYSTCVGWSSEGTCSWFPQNILVCIFCMWLNRQFLTRRFPWGSPLHCFICFVADPSFVLVNLALFPSFFLITSSLIFAWTSWSCRFFFSEQCNQPVFIEGGVIPQEVMEVKATLFSDSMVREAEVVAQDFLKMFSHPFNQQDCWEREYKKEKICFMWKLLLCNNARESVSLK